MNKYLKYAFSIFGCILLLKFIYWIIIIGTTTPIDGMRFWALCAAIVSMQPLVLWGLAIIGLGTAIFALFDAKFELRVKK